MTDRELLEKAAKAAGIELEWWDAGCPGFFSDISDLQGAGVSFTNWNPLTDDGDALRLAVKLRINVTPVYVWRYPWNGETLEDPCVATRRAIVRAAAAIGEKSLQSDIAGLPEDNYYKTQAEAESMNHENIGPGEKT